MASATLSKVTWSKPLAPGSDSVRRYLAMSSAKKSAGELNDPNNKDLVGSTACPNAMLVVTASIVPDTFWTNA